MTLISQIIAKCSMHASNFGCTTCTSGFITLSSLLYDLPTHWRRSGVKTTSATLGCPIYVLSFGVGQKINPCHGTVAPRSMVIFFKKNLKHERECVGCFWFQFGVFWCISWEGHSLPLRMPLFCQYYTSWFTDLWYNHKLKYVEFEVHESSNGKFFLNFGFFSMDMCN